MTEFLNKNSSGLYWHVIYTRPRHEKKVHETLRKMSIESFLPTQKQRRRWSDRKKWVELPLFPSYVFVCPTVLQHDQVLETPGVIKYITFNGRKAVVQKGEIEFLRKVRNEEAPVEISAETFEKEEEVIITGGPFKDHSGRFLRAYGDGRVAVRIEEIGYSVIIKVIPTEVASCQFQHKNMRE